MTAIIMRGLAPEDYHAHPALSRSRLKILLDGTPLDFAEAPPVRTDPLSLELAAQKSNGGGAAPAGAELAGESGAPVPQHGGPVSGALFGDEEVRDEL